MPIWANRNIYHRQDCQSFLFVVVMGVTLGTAQRACSYFEKFHVKFTAISDDENYFLSAMARGLARHNTALLGPVRVKRCLPRQELCERRTCMQGAAVSDFDSLNPHI